MDIAALSMSMNQTQLNHSVDIALTKKVLDLSTSEANGLITMLQTSNPAPHPTSGKNIDVRA